MSCCTGSSQVIVACSLRHAYCNLAHLVWRLTLPEHRAASSMLTPSMRHVQAWRQLSWTTRRQPGLNQELSKLQPVISALQELQATKQEVGSPALIPGIHL